MAATEARPADAATAAAGGNERGARGKVLLAALALPGLLPGAAGADNAPEHAIVEFKQLYYQDSQKDLTRISVLAPSIYGLMPLGEKWSLEGSAVYDSVSGASPRYYTTVSGASHMHDHRVGVDLRPTFYRSRSAYSASVSRSQEDDYISNAGSFDARFSTPDNNTTFNAGIAAAFDSINPVNHLVRNEHKTTYSAIAGVTQALTPVDLVQGQFGYTSGHGYFSDPYKLFDNRPRDRSAETALLRWNHYFENLSRAMRLSYRYYDDSYGVRAHTFELAFEQTVLGSLTLTPAFRYYTQSAAKFYVDPPQGRPFPLLPPGANESLDQRLSAFGALEFSQKAAWQINENWSVDLKAGYYEQRSSWRLIGPGSPGLEPFRYVAFQFGLSRRF